MKKDKLVRLRYIRELERFTNRIVDFFKQERSKEEIREYIDKIFKPLTSIQKTYLNSEYLKELEKFVERSANAPLSKKSNEEIRQDILKEANLLRKLKRKKSFAKEKHKKRLED